MHKVWLIPKMWKQRPIPRKLTANVELLLVFTAVFAIVLKNETSFSKSYFRRRPQNRHSPAWTNKAHIYPLENHKRLCFVAQLFGESQKKPSPVHVGVLHLRKRRLRSAQDTGADAARRGIPHSWYQSEDEQPVRDAGAAVWEVDGNVGGGDRGGYSVDELQVREEQSVWMEGCAAGDRGTFHLLKAVNRENSLRTNAAWDIQDNDFEKTSGTIMKFKGQLCFRNI